MILRLRIFVVKLTSPFSRSFAAFLSFTIMLSFAISPSFAQKSKKADKVLLTNLETHIRYLSDDKLEGRWTGTPGEKMASDYISSAFSQAGLQPKGDHNGWLQTFGIDEGRHVSDDAYFTVNDRQFLLNKEYFPLTISAVGSLSGSPAIALQESGEPWFVDLKDLLDNTSPAALSAAILVRAKECAKKGATALILYNSSGIADNLAYDVWDHPEPASIPVIYITKEARRKYLRDESASLDIKLRVDFTLRHQTGHNIIGYLDNGAANTIVIGTGYSVYKGGSEDSSARNISGVATAIELARLLKESRLRANNYLFVAFSGEAQHLYGSGYFIAHPPIDLSKVNYMIDLDRLGSLSDSSHVLPIGGYGTSPAWSVVCNKVVDKRSLTIRPDNEATGPGDHLSFYHRNIPVLFFPAGAHSANQGTNDYKGDLQILKFIYDIVQATNGMARMAFTPAPI
jgi:hypothetical protein